MTQRFLTPLAWCLIHLNFKLFLLLYDLPLELCHLLYSQKSVLVDAWELKCFLHTEIWCSELASVNQLCPYVIISVLQLWSLRRYLISPLHWVLHIYFSIVRVESKISFFSKLWSWTHSAFLLYKLTQIFPNSLLSVRNWRQELPCGSRSSFAGNSFLLPRNLSAQSRRLVLLTLSLLQGLGTYVSFTHRLPGWQEFFSLWNHPIISLLFISHAFVMSR